MSLGSFALISSHFAGFFLSALGVTYHTPLARSFSMIRMARFPMQCSFEEGSYHPHSTCMKLMGVGALQHANAINLTMFKQDF